MPTHTDLYLAAGVCSYSQSWSPLWLQGPEITRGSLLMLASETRQQPLYTETVPEPLDFDSQIAWLDKCFKQAGAPTQLLVPSQELAEALRARCPRSEIVVESSPPHHGWIREAYVPFEAENVPFSVVRMLGEKKAGELYAQSDRFLRLELWKNIQDDEIFRFQSGRREFGVVVGGSTRFQDNGISIYSSVKEAMKHSQPPVVCFGPGNPCLVHYQDLNFLERRQIRIPQLLPRLKAPMFMLDPKDRRQSLKDLNWLMRHLPELASSGASLTEAGKRRLERTDLRVKPGRAGLFPAFWDKQAC